MRVLLVEDDLMLGRATRDVLQTVFAVDWHRFVQDAQDALQQSQYNLAILDISLPDGSGMDLLKTIRSQESKTPVLFLTARDTVKYRVEGLNAGADDYLVKPFDVDELIARCMALIRRSNNTFNKKITWGTAVFDPQGRTLTVAGKPISLSRRELAVLDYLIKNIGKVLSKSQIENSIYNGEQEIKSNTIEVHISSLRRKIGRDFIKTVRGIGYTVPIQK